MANKDTCTSLQGLFSGQDLRPVTFYVVRHGETVFNVEGKVQGWCDSPLTLKGRDGARALGNMLAEVPFQCAYSSDSQRAAQTLEELLKAQENAASCFSPNPHKTPSLHVSRVQDARLREWCYGDLEGLPGNQLRQVLIQGFGADLSMEEHNRRLPEVANILASADSQGRAENFASICARLKEFFIDAVTAAQDGDSSNVLIVTHSFVVRTLLYLTDPAQINNPLKIPNTSVTTLAFSGEEFALDRVGVTQW